MPELTPRLTYSPEGILEIRRGWHNDSDSSRLVYEAKLLPLAEQPGYEVVDEYPEATIRVDVGKVLSKGKKPDHFYHNPNAEELIRNLNPFTGFSGYTDEMEGAEDYYIEPDDNVFSLDYFNTHGAGGVVYPQLQRWLNAGGLNEETAKACLKALALPYGAEGRRQLREDRHLSYYHTDGKNAQAGIGGFGFSVTSRYDNFGIDKREDTDDGPVYKRGEVKWNWVDLTTIGSCACWGVMGDDRDRVHISPKATRLYEMHPHNVDFATQSVSLVLGMGTLAYAAARYEGTEDILADVQWKDKRR